MTAETQTWLEQNIRAGFTAERGPAWWWAGDPVSQYEGAVPREEAMRLLGFEVAEGPVFTRLADGTELIDVTRKSIVRPDTKTILGMPGTGYKIHDYVEWLINNVFTMMDGHAEIGSVGLLKGSALAFVQIEFPQTMQHAGEKFRPFITAVSSLDSSTATTYKSGCTRVACDNALSAFLRERTAALRKRHTSGSTVNATELREHFNVQLETIAEDYVAELDALLNVEVSDKQWAEFLDLHVPIPEEKGRAKTIATNKHDALNELYFKDPRVAPWAGSEWGALMSVSTFDQHEASFKGTNRVERNALAFLEGKTTRQEAEARRVLESVLT